MDAAPHVPDAPAAQVTRLSWPLVVLVCVGVWLHAADTLMATTIMPSAIAEIGGLAYVYWTLALYELGSIVAGSMTGLLALRVGLRGAMSGAAGVYVLGCVASALAPTMGVMLLGRLVQGLGGGAMLALSYVGVSQLFPAPLWPRVLAITASVWGVSALVGPVVGGTFAQIGHWRGAFWAFAAQGVVLVVATPLLVPARAAVATVAEPFPGRQLLALTVGVLALSAAGVQDDPRTIIALALFGLVALASVLWLERNAAGRLFPRAPLGFATPWGPGYVMVLAFAAATVSFTLYGPLLMAALFDTTPLAAGFLVAIESIAWTLAAIAFAGAPASREPSLIRGGAVCISVGVVALAWTMPRGPVWALGAWVGLQGIGFGMCWAFLLRRIVASVPAVDSERASAAVPTMQMIGYAIGAATCGMVANVLGLVEGASLDVVRTVAWWIFAAFLPLAAVGLAGAWRIAAPSRAQAHTMGSP
jgi:MFS family permease